MPLLTALPNNPAVPPAAPHNPRLPLPFSANIVLTPPRHYRTHKGHLLLRWVSAPRYATSEAFLFVRASHNERNDAQIRTPFQPKQNFHALSFRVWGYSVASRRAKLSRGTPPLPQARRKRRAASRPALTSAFAASRVRLRPNQHRTERSG